MASCNVFHNDELWIIVLCSQLYNIFHCLDIRIQHSERKKTAIQYMQEIVPSSVFQICFFLPLTMNVDDDENDIELWWSFPHNISASVCVWSSCGSKISFFMRAIKKSVFGWMCTLVECCIELYAIKTKTHKQFSSKYLETHNLCYYL